MENRAVQMDLRPEARSQEEKLCMVVVMGVTGAGKSYFINKLAGREVTEEGNSLHACTQGCGMIPLKIGGTKVLIIDTPGFDEAKRSDSEILTEIARLLSAQYQLGVELKGIIYIHRITDIRYGRSAAKTFEIFKRICGEKPLKNVLLVTSRWADGMNEKLGSQREGELKENFWAYMLDKGSNMSRFYGDHDSAVMLVGQLLIKDSIVLELQRDLVDHGKKLNETAAGAYVNDNLEDLKAEYRKELASLEKLREDLILEQDRTRNRRIQKDLEREKAHLEEASEQQASLRRRIGDEVREGIKQKRSSMHLLSKVLPTVLDILGAFVGIPPGVISTATYVVGSAVGSAVSSWFLSV
jgi:GTPase SAR1 family protein